MFDPSHFSFVEVACLVTFKRLSNYELQQGHTEKLVYLDSLVLVLQQASVTGCLQTCIDALGFCFSEQAILEPAANALA